MGGGILPVSKHKNTIYFLFGLESEDDKLWSDFGGSTIGREMPFQTAIREGYEELNGLLGNVNDLKRRVSNNLVIELCDDDFNPKYTTFLFTLPYDNLLPVYFNNQHAFIKENLPHIVNKKGFFEKSKIQWMTFSDIKKNRHKFRVFYRNVIDNILLNEKEIREKL